MMTQDAALILVICVLVNVYSLPLVDQMRSNAQRWNSLHSDHLDSDAAYHSLAKIQSSLEPVAPAHPALELYEELKRGSHGMGKRVLYKDEAELLNAWKNRLEYNKRGLHNGMGR